MNRELNMIRNLLNNWKTTSAGLLMIAGSVVHLVFAVKAGTANENAWTIAITAILGGIGLLVAGDASATQGQSQPNGATSKELAAEIPAINPPANPAQPKT
jgi:hypothetical protein